VRDALKDNDVVNNRTTPKANTISDSEVIKLAASSKGKLTAASLCMKSGVSVDKAKETLNSLQDKGVFDIHVTDNGVIVYLLVDTDLIQK
ncbi:MAG: hypothetical protein AAGI07_08265, partial [Bacteroidota bacterium]